MRLLTARVLAALSVLVSAAAVACPACAARDASGAAGRGAWVVALLVAMPFLIAGVVAGFVRRWNRA